MIEQSTVPTHAPNLDYRLSKEYSGKILHHVLQKSACLKSQFLPVFPNNRTQNLNWPLQRLFRHSLAVLPKHLVLMGSAIQCCQNDFGKKQCIHLLSNSKFVLTGVRFRSIADDRHHLLDLALLEYCETTKPTCQNEALLPTVHGNVVPTPAYTA